VRQFDLRTPRRRSASSSKSIFTVGGKVLLIRTVIKHCLNRLINLFFILVPRGNKYGIFSSYEGALASIPAARLTGYDHDVAASLYADSCEELRPSDYAVLFYIKPLLEKCKGVFDLGGNLGRSFFPFDRVLGLPDDFTWLICEVPAVAQLGTRIVAEKGERRLKFTTNVLDLSDHEILLTSGTLQFLRESLQDILSTTKVRPHHVFVNRTAIWRGPTYYTLEDLGKIVSPYCVRNEDEFVEGMRKVGYTLRNSWDCPDSSCHIRRYPNRSLSKYRGYYFTREGDGPNCQEGSKVSSLFPATV
jgi:putative methyltransferase (TIGR04325 family)